MKVDGLVLNEVFDYLRKLKRAKPYEAGYVESFLTSLIEEIAELREENETLKKSPADCVGSKMEVPDEEEDFEEYIGYDNKGEKQ